MNQSIYLLISSTKWQ